MVNVTPLSGKWKVEQTQKKENMYFFYGQKKISL